MQIETTDALPTIIVFGAHYWGRGATVADALAAARWLRPGDKVLACAATADAYCHEVTGDLYCTARGPVYTATVAPGARRLSKLTLYREARNETA